MGALFKLQKEVVFFLEAGGQAGVWCMLTCFSTYDLVALRKTYTCVAVERCPGFGLPASRAGVTEMILRCAEHLDDPDVARLMDAVNLKLGMSPAACKRFRQRAALSRPPRPVGVLSR